VRDSFACWPVRLARSEDATQCDRCISSFLTLNLRKGKGSTLSDLCGSAFELDYIILWASVCSSGELADKELLSDTGAHSFSSADGEVPENKSGTAVGFRIVKVR
jgi:hypothetical protein